VAPRAAGLEAMQKIKSMEKEDENNEKDKDHEMTTSQKRSLYKDRSMGIKARVLERRRYKTSVSVSDEMSACSSGAIQCLTKEAAAMQHITLVYTMVRRFIAFDNYDALLQMTGAVTGIQALFSHHKSQHSLLQYMEVLNEVCVQWLSEEIDFSLYYSIMLDECKDFSGKEQISFYIRYVNKDFLPVQHFLTFIPMDSTGCNGVYLFEKFKEVL
jgi:hypothetical protein